MSKVSHYLQEHLMGEVVDSRDVREYFATDASIFRVLPAFAVYPRNENDVRKTARFTWQLAERGRVLPMTARGAGTDEAGAAIGNGIIISMPAHMNRILELDTKSGDVVVEPGLNYGKLQQTLQTHNRWLPPFPASIEYSTIGGAVANNAAGEKSIKYGSTREYVKGLRVVLANGEVIKTERLAKRELNKKLGLATFEGEIYRSIDGLLDDNSELIEQTVLHVSKNAAGYNLAGIKQKDGSLDLTPLFVGAEGTLGIISEIELETESFSPDTTLLVAYFDSMNEVCQAIDALRKLPKLPSSLELVDRNLLQMAAKINPNQLKDVVEDPLPEAVLLIEYDDSGEGARKKIARQASKILDAHAAKYEVESNANEQERYWKIRHASSLLLTHTENTSTAVPIVDDGIVPADKLREFVSKIYELFKAHRLPVALWGHAGDANLHIQPFFDLAQLGDRQRVFKLIDEYYNLVISLGGSTSGQMGDGRLRAPYLPKLYGAEMYTLFEKVKKIFDPYGTLNPGVKIGVELNDVKPLVRASYSLGHLYNHLPRT